MEQGITTPPYHHSLGGAAPHSHGELHRPQASHASLPVVHGTLPCVRATQLVSEDPSLHVLLGFAVDRISLKLTLLRVQ